MATKATIDDDGYLKLDAASLVQAMPDSVKRDLAKYALFDELLLTGILEALVRGTMWSDDDEGPWWFGGDTFTKLRLQLLPLLPEITAEAVRHLEAEMRAARTERDRWHEACWALERDWPEGRRERKHYGPRNPMTKEQAAEYLRGIEQSLAAKPTQQDELFFVRYQLLGRTHLWGPAIWNEAQPQYVEIINLEGVSNAEVVPASEVMGNG